MNAIAAIASAHRRTEARWQSLRDKDYPAEVQERGQLAESMRASREEYDRRIAALPRLVAGIMRFTHISR